MIEINVWRDPYDIGVNITSKRKIELQSGITILVGCNGAGKTTLLRNIEEECKTNKIPCHMYDNLSDGGSSCFNDLIDNEDFSELSYMVSASEGERIMCYVGRESSLYKEFFGTGYYKNQSYKFSSLFRGKMDSYDNEKRRVLLYDATDSGLSIDHIVELKSFFNKVCKDAEDNGIDLYIVISSNDYELCVDNRCLDVQTGNDVYFKEYTEYKKFILESRHKKEIRLQKERDHREKLKVKNQKKYAKLKEKNEVKIKSIKEKANSENRDLSFREEWMIEDLKRELREFQRKNIM